jgi:hypothetical protein
VEINLVHFRDELAKGRILLACGIEMLLVENVKYLATRSCG